MNHKAHSALLSLATVLTTSWAIAESVWGISRYFGPEGRPSKPRRLVLSRLSAAKEGFLRLLYYLAGIVLTTALYAGLSSYAEFINTPPPCALENHHGPGNCPVQVLRWYPESAIEAWHTAAPKWTA